MSGYDSALSIFRYVQSYGNGEGSQFNAFGNTNIYLFSFDKSSSMK